MDEAKISIGNNPACTVYIGANFFTNCDVHTGG